MQHPNSSASPDRLEPWLQALRSDPAPVGLPERTYQAVLARASKPEPAPLAWTPSLARRAAAVLLAIGVAGLGGYFLSGGVGTVVAKHRDGPSESDRLRLIAAWTELGAGPELAEEILRQKALFAEAPLPADPAERRLLADRQEARILALLPEAVRARYAERAGLSASEVGRLLRLLEEGPR